MGSGISLDLDLDLSLLFDEEDTVDYDVRDIKLADAGRLKIEWAEATMPVLRLIRKQIGRAHV